MTYRVLLDPATRRTSAPYTVDELRRFVEAGNLATDAWLAGGDGRFYRVAEVLSQAQPEGWPWWLKLAAGAAAVFVGAKAWQHATTSPHDRRVRREAKRLERRGAFVTADHIGWRDGAPGIIGGHRPDVHAVWPDGREEVVEVETPASVDSTHTWHQDRAFRRYAARYRGVNYRLVVAE